MNITTTSITTTTTATITSTPSPLCILRDFTIRRTRRLLPLWSLTWHFRALNDNRNSLLDHSTVEETEERARTRNKRRNFGGKRQKKQRKVPCFETGHVKIKTNTAAKAGDKNFLLQINCAASVPCEFRVRVNCSKREKSALLWLISWSLDVLFLPYCEIMETQGWNYGNRCRNRVCWAALCSNGA